MNPRSIRFRLTAWYAGLLLITALAFASFTYQRLSHYLSDVLIQSLSSRAARIGNSLVAGIPATGEQYVINEVKARYAPELNDWFIRVIRPDYSVLYVSGVPNDNSFDPKTTALVIIDMQKDCGYFLLPWLNIQNAMKIFMSTAHPTFQ